ncbi:FAD-dependent oxidoreductase [Papillibacter cinnamivorans]|uniref:2,4-dienoyl-CoA reductase (NADPH2) n=1 Tax=Papillibacter cinnamivorans DSM 12816 TaxID=1122930 RepID=A0A1W2BU10_9FIRM|nr:FAD-dependent oxidoreductase [Papillibacter cinnamivorans]SMC76214.1 2,4-dienoyl-CoA reductase (NADPH2) [Papillibacter cinnamivorans DSM 12816]
MEFKRLFSPINVRGLTLKNRVVMPAIHHLYTDNGFATPRFNQYYWRRAEGGPGLIIVGGCRFDDYGGPLSMMSLRTDDTIPGWREFTDGMHARNCPVAVQLYHAGRYSHSSCVPEGKQALAPSAVYSTFTRETPKEITKEEIREVIDNWAQGARRAKEAGFDAVEIIGGAGYLISQFLSPVTNLRTDEYGGSWENRCRFPREVVAAVRAAVGDYPVFMRIAGNDFIPGSNTNVQAVEFAKVMEQAGIDLLNVTGGWHETVVPQLPGELPVGGFTYLAAAVKKAVNIPVMACNRINDPVIAEETLALERGDLIGVGRPMIADPDWCRKAREGNTRLIRRCVACNQGCLAKTFFNKSVECLVNGTAGREYLIDENVRTQSPKKVLVIGGGPGGCEFALRAKRAGHFVTLWEKSSRLGGQLHLVMMPPSKGEFIHLIEYYEAMLAECGVKVELCKEGTPENIEAAGFDAVVIASGVIPNTLTLPGDTSGIDVCTAAAVLAGECMPGKNVVVVGGGSVGCETAQYLAHRGSISPEELYFLTVHRAETPEKIDYMVNHSDRAVTIIEIAKRIGAGFELGTGWPIFKDLKRLNVRQHALTKITDIRNQTVYAQMEKDGAVTNLEIPCDTIVLAVGSHPDNALYESLKDRLPRVYALGDSKKVGKVQDAIQDAVDLAARI